MYQGSLTGPEVTIQLLRMGFPYQYIYTEWLQQSNFVFHEVTNLLVLDSPDYQEDNKSMRFLVISLPTKVMVLLRNSNHTPKITYTFCRDVPEIHQFLKIKLCPITTYV